MPRWIHKVPARTFLFGYSIEGLKDISKHVEFAEACEIPAALVTG
jgi:hypothetical protein